VRLPKAELGKVTEGGKALSEGDGILRSRQDGDSVVVEIGSGQYQFTHSLTQPASPQKGAFGSTKTASTSPEIRIGLHRERTLR
jgi:hypothetical protein